jgi:ATP-dependent RNA helicase DeaD
MTEFEGVLPALGQALDKRGYTTLTPVQKAVIAQELGQADALVSAQTGSGKTVAFGMAMAPTLLDGAERFERARAPLALIIAPTRELALQVKRELEWLYELTGASIASCVGGMDMRTERRNLDQGAHIVVGTPGRLRDHIERGSFNTKGLRAVVLDEADEMLDLGFREDLEYILDTTPKDRRTLMFSATVPRSIVTLAKRYQRDATRISTQEEEKQHLDIEYRALPVATNDRENAIINVLRYFNPKNALVFCATRATVNHMTSRFNNRGFPVVALSGELSQNERTHALQAMRDGRAQICIATDVAARGIDLPNLELVVHADMPKTAEMLLHRSGRTGRAGRKGVCALIVPHNRRKGAERLLRQANVTATWERPPSIEAITQRDRERFLNDPALSEPITETESDFVKELLSRYNAEQIAAALVRIHQTKNPAPEELFDTPLEPEQKKRDYFEGGVWFALSIGRKHNAEPRWIVPMLCRAGHITKRDIGAIKIKETETYVELAPECVKQVLDAVGPTQKIEKTVTMVPMDGPPEGSQDRPRAVEERNYAKKRTFKSKKPPRDSKPKNDAQRANFEKKATPQKPRDEADSESRNSDTPKHRIVKKSKRRDRDEKSWEKPAKKSKDKKPHRGKSTNPKPKKNKSTKGGCTPLRRKRTTD